MARPKKDQTMTPTTTEVKPVEKIAKKRIFDLDKFEKKTVEVKYILPAPLTDASEVLAIPEEKLLSLVNAGLKRQALLDAKASVTGASPKLVNQFLVTFRLMPPYSGMVENGADGKPTKESKAAQTKAIYAFIQSVPQILDGLKAAAAAQSDEDEDEEETEENEN